MNNASSSFQQIQVPREKQRHIPSLSPDAIRSEPSDANPQSGAEHRPSAQLSLKHSESQMLCFKCAASLFKSDLYLLAYVTGCCLSAPSRHSIFCV